VITRLLALIKKELLAIKNDKKSLFVVIFPPLIQIFIFSYAATLEIKNLDLIIMDQDGSRQSRDLIEQFKGSAYVQNVMFAKSYQDGKKAINTQKVIAFIVIPEGFAKHLGTRSSKIQIILDGRRSHSAQISEGYISQMVMMFQAQHGYATPVQIIERNFYNPNLTNFWWIVPSLFGTITLVVALILTSLSIARERELGTFDQILVSPLRPFEILLGKLLPALFISVAESSIIILIALFFFDVPLVGPLWLLYIGLVIFLFSMSGIGLFVSALSSTQQQAILGAFVVMLPSILLSGFATPVENMPQWLQPITDLVPLKYFLVIIKGVFLKDIDLSTALQGLAAMTALGIIFMAVAMFYFKRKTS
jgi:ABC-2 type transport system permease protein